jgi:hypothetical protein
MDGAPLNVVTIGDGDLSFSLALARCTRNTRVVATTYSEAADVRSFYRNAAAIIQVPCKPPLLPGGCSLMRHLNV